MQTRAQEVGHPSKLVKSRKLPFGNVGFNFLGMFDSHVLVGSWKANQYTARDTLGAGNSKYQQDDTRERWSDLPGSLVKPNLVLMALRRAKRVRLWNIVYVRKSARDTMTELRYI